MCRFLLISLGLLIALPAVVASDPPIGLPTQVQTIDELVERGWKDFEIRPAKEVDDAIWCRRVFLDVIGRIPTTAELKEFVERSRQGQTRQVGGSTATR